MTAKDYFPLKKGLSLEYESESDDGTNSFKNEILSVVKRGKEIRALVRHSIARGSSPSKVSEYTVIRNSAGVYRFKEKLFPLPLAKGKKWAVSPNEYKVASLEETVSVPAGTFKNCLRVTYLTSGGDGGGGEIDYAPGVGLIRHWCNDESQPFEFVLTSR